MDAEQGNRLDAGARPSSLQVALDLKQVARCDIFIGDEDAVGRTPWGRVFGGQVLAQALVAARRTVPEGYRVHSLHGFFLLAGKSGVELLFEVDRVRDGRSFATRAVKASQQNEAIFHMTVSFHRPEWGPTFQTPGRELLAIGRSRGFTEGRLPTPEELLARGVPVERATWADNRGDTQTMLIASGDWWSLRYMRHRTRLPDNVPGLHESIFAWMTDSNMVSIVCLPHERRQQLNFPMRFSLDHSIHFHSPPFRADEWLIFSNRTTVSGGARGLARCEVYTLDGQLVATVTQEALVRVPREVAEREEERAAAQREEERRGAVGDDSIGRAKL